MGLKDLLKNNPIAKRIAENASKQLTQEDIYLYRFQLPVVLITTCSCNYVVLLSSTGLGYY
jgi:hypothetical protein